jgi:hypothetical protein
MIVVTEVVEHKDGSATITFDVSDDAKQALINEGLTALLEKAVSEQHPEYEIKEGLSDD